MMKKQKLRYFIFLMTFAMVGLIALQFYWVNVSIEVNRERFTQNVHEALNEVVKKLEQKEVMYVAQQTMGRPLNLEGFLGIFVDSLEGLENKQYSTDQNPKKPTSLQENTDTTQLDAKFKDQSELLVSERDAPDQVISRRDRMQQLRQSHGKGPESNKAKKLFPIANKSDIVHFIIEELQSRKQPIEQRLNKNLLNSLLKRELGNRGIHIGYKFWVENKSRGKEATYYLIEQLPTAALLPDTDFQAVLFPTDLLGNQYVLKIFFPDQQAFILKNMGWVFITSLLFIALIIFCMAYAVWTIIQQKKISEITHDFINNMTHELKTPIATVAIACEAIQDPDIRQLPNQVNRYLNIIREENERLGNQVEKVLQIAVLDRGDFQLKINPINVHEVIQKALRNIIIQIEMRQGKIETDLKALNPVIDADELHINNMISNLLDNANKYSPNAPEITIATQNTENGVKISISDKGQGMARETINKVFDKFYRVSTGNIHNVKGFGLGLSYVKTMLDAHKGSVDVKSELNKGSTFTLFLPYKQNQES
ncbi:MAG: HAMP domain-containing sensor histidine kinase [Microscillaceae bacterium]|nr:HAMP domain-containing sensor histidine kinase [Microscillaceae bacterium]